MIDIRDELIKAIDERFEILKEKLEFDKTYYGKIIGIDGKKCVVEINGINYNSQIKDGISVVVGDVVIIKAPSNNFSYIYIDGKTGYVASAGR